MNDVLRERDQRLAVVRAQRHGGRPSFRLVLGAQARERSGRAPETEAPALERER